MALSAIKGDKTLAELAQPFDVRPNQITATRAQLLEGQRQFPAAERKMMIEREDALPVKRQPEVLAISRSCVC